ncbi:thioredoxin-disulfide reductase [bacterium]|jgi:thioredoxin reductase (NADPH)|nr:thioredoxin-disulfide reductase [bacterium]
MSTEQSGELSKIEDVVIIGSGPAAHTAAIYAARADLKPLMFEGLFAAGVAAGGQLTTTTEIENFPGFLDISGTELMTKMRDQAAHWGTQIFTETVDSIDVSKSPFTVVSDSQTVKTKTIILATGATAQRLGLPGEETYWQKGISACAVCDGALPIFRNKPMVVIGGGDTAAEEATFLTKFASKVHLLVRRDEMRASKAMQQRVFDNEKIEIHWNTEATEAVGEKLLTGVAVLNSKTKETKTISASGLFYAIGHTPNTTFLNNQLELDSTGYIITKNGSPETSIPGVFACGDVQDKVYRQAITAAGSGCQAALLAERFIG